MSKTEHLGQITPLSYAFTTGIILSILYGNGAWAIRGRLDPGCMSAPRKSLRLQEVAAKRSAQNHASEMHPTNEREQLKTGSVQTAAISTLRTRPPHISRKGAGRSEYNCVMLLWSHAGAMRVAAFDRSVRAFSVVMKRACSGP